MPEPEGVGIPNPEWWVTCGDVVVHRSDSAWCMSVPVALRHPLHHAFHVDYRNVPRGQAMRRFLALVNTGARV